MGFGYLFVGLLITANITTYPSLTMFPALLLCLLGMLTLRLYDRRLRYAYFWLLASLLIAGIAFVLEALRLIGLGGENWLSLLDTTLPILRDCTLLCFTAWLWGGVVSLSREVGLPRLTARAQFCGAMVPLSYALSAALNLPLSEDWYAALCAHAFFPVLLFRLAVLVIQAIVMYSCYMQICRPEDMDMAPRKTGIRPLDDLQARMDEKEEARQKATREEMARIYQERTEKYHEKQEQKERKKKK